MTLGYDRWIYPIDIDSSNNTIVFKESDVSGQTATVSLSTGRYWAVLTSGIIPSPITSLYREIETTIGGASLPGAGTYTLERIDPTATQNTFAKKSGLRLSYSDTDLTEFGLLFSDANFTLPPELLGYLPGRSTDATTTGQQLDAPHTCSGTWSSPRVARKTDDTVYTQNHRRVTYDNQINDRWGGEAIQFRAFRYQNVPATHVRTGRATRGAYAKVGSLADNDENNVWEDVWEAMSDGSEAIVIHDHGDTDEDFANQSEYELVRLTEKTLDGDIEFEETIDQKNRSAEFYDIQFEIEANPDHSPYTY